MNIYELLCRAEEKEVRFKALTRLSVEDAYNFFATFGKFPNEKEIDSISIIGVEKTIDFIFDCGKPFAASNILFVEFEKLSSARERFFHLVTKEVEKFIATIKRIFK